MKAYIYDVEENSLAPHRHVSKIKEFGLFDKSLNVNSLHKRPLPRLFLTLLCLQNYRTYMAHIVLVRYSITLLPILLFRSIIRRKTVIEFNGSLSQDLLDRQRGAFVSTITKYMLKFTRPYAVYLVSHNLKEEFRILFPHANIVVLENGVDKVPISAVSRSTSKTIRFAYVGSLAYREGVDTAMEFLTLVNFPFELHYFGNEAIEETAMSIGFKGRIVTHFYEDYSVLIRELSNCDLAVHFRRNASIGDSQGIPFKTLDYINAGLPIIASDISFYTALSNSYPVVFSLDELDNISFMKDMALKCKETVLKDYDWDNVKTGLNILIND